MAQESKGVGIADFKLPTSLFATNRKKLYERYAAHEKKYKEKAAVVLQGGMCGVATHRSTCCFGSLCWCCYVVYCVVGDEQMRYDTDHELLFRQESNFLYFFGVNEPGCFGVLDLDAQESILFVPRRSSDYALWCGTPPTLKEYQVRYGTEFVYYSDEVAQVLKDRKIEVVLTVYGQNTDSGAYSIPASFKGIDEFKVDKELIHPEIVECRVIKSEEELDVLRYIVGISSKAHIEVMRQARPGMKEYQLEAIFRHYTQMKGGSRYLAYTCICGSGHNGATLHYGHAGAPNDAVIKEEDMLLLDMGAEYQGYCSDITCSFPASGKFSEDQKIIYNMVLAAQDAVENAIKPGVNWVDMHRLAERVILEHLVKHKFVIPNGKSLEELHKLHIPAIFMPHGLGHFMGLDTHDVGGYPKGVERKTEPGVCCLRTARDLKKGMVLTVEPGVYFIAEQLDRALANPEQAPYLNKDMLQRFRKFGGVRLEDDVVVTEDGCEDMTQVPRTVEEVEKVLLDGRGK